MSAAQGLLNSVFSCSSPASKAMTKRRLRQTRSLDPAIIRHCGTGTDGASGASLSGAADAGASPERSAVKPALRTKIPTLKEPISPSLSSPSIPLDVSPSSNFHFDYDIVKRAKRNTAGDLPFLVRGPGAAPSGSTGTLFSPRRWLQRKVQPSSSHAYAVWKSEVKLFFPLFRLLWFQFILQVNQPTIHPQGTTMSSSLHAVSLEKELPSISIPSFDPPIIKSI